jgi:predicted nucleotidyltransferase
MSVNSHLTSLSSKLVLSASEKSSISTSISTLRYRLNDYFEDSIISQEQFGSSTRGTILPRKADENSDIDYMVEFDISNGKMKPQTYIDRLKRFAESKYSRSEIHQSHPTIILQLNHIHFELVPAIKEFYNLQIPSQSSSWQEWISTNPSEINRRLTDKNIQNNYHIKPLVRLVKFWNAKNGYHFRSFELEEYIIGSSFLYCTALKDYFYKFWRGFSCSYDTPQYVKEKVDRAKKYAEKARELEETGWPVSAESEIKKIVPDL